MEPDVGSHPTVLNTDGFVVDSNILCYKADSTTVLLLLILNKEHAVSRL